MLSDDECPYTKFIKSLTAKEKAKLLALFRRLADHGLIQDGHKFKKLDGDLWEFKARTPETGLRVTCYRDGDTWILLTGFRKNEDDADPREIKLAKSVMAEDRKLHRRD